MGQKIKRAHVCLDIPEMKRLVRHLNGLIENEDEESVFTIEIKHPVLGVGDYKENDECLHTLKVWDGTWSDQPDQTFVLTSWY